MTINPTDELADPFGHAGPAPNVKTAPPFLTAANAEGDAMQVHVHGDGDEPVVWLSVAYDSPAEVGLDMLTAPAGLSAEQATLLGNRLLELAGQASGGTA